MVVAAGPGTDLEAPARSDEPTVSRDEATDADTRTTVSLRRAVGWTLATLAAAVLLQLVVYRNGGHTALGDMPGRFFAWKLNPGALPYLDRPVEYPVVIGYLGYVTSSVAGTATRFFVANGFLNVGLAIAMTCLLRVRGGHRIWRWIAGAPLVLYAFHNWDLVAMVPAIIGLVAFTNGKDRLAGSSLAFGASAKIFPGLFLPPLIVMRWCSGDRRGAYRLAAWAAGVTVVLNAPVALASPSGWWYPATFQGHRHATWGSVGSWLLNVPGVDQLVKADPARAANALAAVTLIAALTAVTVLAVRRRLDPIAVGAAVTAVFLLTNKVYSPNYDLWIVPFFVLLPFTRRHWWAFCAADLGVFTLVFGRFHGLWDIGTVRIVLPAFVAVRAITLVWLVVVSTRRAGHGTASPTTVIDLATGENAEEIPSLRSHHSHM